MSTHASDAGTAVAAVAQRFNALRGVEPSLGQFVSTEFDNVQPGVNTQSLYFTSPHRVFYRVAGGDAQLFQRCLIYVRNAAPVAGLPGGDPDATLGGFMPPAATAWAPFEPKQTSHTYYFAGQFFIGFLNWRWDSGLRLRKDVYTRGALYTLSFDDHGDHPDYNDYVVQVAAVLLNAAPPDADRSDEVQGEFRASERPEELSAADA
jgi:hypothetical protein